MAQEVIYEGYEDIEKLAFESWKKENARNSTPIPKNIYEWAFIVGYHQSQEDIKKKFN